MFRFNFCPECEAMLYFHAYIYLSERRPDPARQNSPIQYEFQPPIEFPVKAEPEFPASPPTGTKRSRNDLDFTC